MANSKNENSVRYEVITQEDNNGDLIIPIPPAVLKKLGWQEGDDLEIAVDEQGQIIFKKTNR